MVSYCCIKGCSSNSSAKKKYSDKRKTFFPFPSNPQLKARWLEVLGCPNWNPPRQARVCSEHYTEIDNIAEEPYENKYFKGKEESDGRVCRICLAVDVKMFSLIDNVLNTSYKNVFTSYSNTDWLPEYICYECIAQVIKADKLIKKSLLAKNILENILDKHGHINKQLVINQDRSHLMSSLSFNDVPKTNYDLVYDDDLKCYTYIDKNNGNVKEEDSEDEIKDFEISHPYEDRQNDDKIVKVDSDETLESNYDVSDTKDDSSSIDDDLDKTFIVIMHDHDYDEDNVPLAETIKNESVKNIVKKAKKRKAVRRNTSDLSSEEIEAQQYFNVTVLSVKEQIEERERLKETDAYRDALHKCEICYRTYLHPNAFKAHMELHDISKGTAECPVCKLRFKTEVLATSHARRMHLKKFECKICHRSFTNVRLAKSHYQCRHEDLENKCEHCDYIATCESDLSSHIVTCPSGATCDVTGATSSDACPKSDPYCKECDLSFKSDEDYKEHTSKSPHKNSIRSQVHGGRRAVWTMPGDCYPTQCEHCGSVVRNRREHYFHVRRAHPRELERYRAVITAVCQTCGKGFQNTTKLHLHELRHSGVGTVHCPHCPRMFYDKFQLGRHIKVHSDERPYQCNLCDQTFKYKSNLGRHAKVHTGTLSYECTMCGKGFRYSSSRNLHVKTVHYKMPQPPRKRRTDKHKKNDYSNQGN